MNSGDFAFLFTLGCIALVGVCLVMGWWESRPEPLEWDQDAPMCAGCGSRRCRMEHPVRPWVENRKR